MGTGSEKDKTVFIAILTHACLIFAANAKFAS